MKAATMGLALLVGLFADCIPAKAQNEVPSAAAGQTATQSSPAQEQNSAGQLSETHNVENARKGSAGDTVLERKVRDKLFANPEFKNLNVEARSGVVTLTGNVNSADDQSKATNVVKQVRGVRSVVAKITVGASTSVAPNKSGPVNTGTGATAPNTAGSIAGNTEQQSGSEGSAAAPPSTPTPSAPVSPNTGSSTPDSAGPGSSTSGNVTGTSSQPNSATNTSPGSGATEGKAADSSGGLMPSMTAATQLQSQIQNALTNEPTLANSNINVNVSDNEITLSGSVGNGKERQTAERIANSFAENRRVADHLTVGGKK